MLLVPNRREGLSTDSGHFCLYFDDYSSLKRKIFSSRSCAISSIYVLAVGNTPYGNWRTLPKRTSVVTAVRLRRKLTFTAIFFVVLSDQFDVFSTRKMSQKRTLEISLRHLLVNLKSVRVLAPPMLFSIELRRQCQPLIIPPIQASRGAPRFVKL